MKKALHALLLSLTFATPLAHATPSVPVAGKDYDVVKAPTQPNEPDGKVEVTEFFWYGCPHCAEFEPVLEAWAKKEGKKIDLKRVPVPMSNAILPHSRMYYALSGLGASERLMPALFNAIAGHGVPLLTPENQAAFLEKYGIDKKTYLQAYQSMRVEADASRATKLVHDYGIDGVPTVIVNGRYETGPAYTGSFDGSVAVLDYLVDHVAQH
ncbi:thiol:disulfide interchange protein DsbA/DsbL [Burkholderia ubonensis]|uniref:thiol:disulfide interchange protein DsbA/DsbL n=1 Tax=Burkholderia ubonensis TaxID=101571 RepID=UPI0008FD98C0|nr:thiol:disulfide interchange protein DsbA/DsbL [Burkholderia ubonensis]OJA84452.1 thiol:disulfide interchange protein [Burkholderia ubonensis]